jgi:hypothetical protein
MVFDAGMAARYDGGRRLRTADVRAWMDAARPYLPGVGGRILDLGAGTGRFTLALSEATGATVIGCEPSGAMRAVYAAGLLVGGAAEAMPFRDGVFDAIWAPSRATCGGCFHPAGAWWCGPGSGFRTSCRSIGIFPPRGPIGPRCRHCWRR